MRSLLSRPFVPNAVQCAIRDVIGLAGELLGGLPTDQANITAYCSCKAVLDASAVSDVTAAPECRGASDRVDLGDSSQSGDGTQEGDSMADMYCGQFNGSNRPTTGECEGETEGRCRWESNAYSDGPCTGHEWDTGMCTGWCVPS